LNQHLYEALVESAAPSASCISRYDTLRVTKVKPRRLFEPFDSQAAFSYINRERLFADFIKAWSRRLSKHIMAYRAVDFNYREFAIAILALASGEFKLLADQSPPPDGREDLKVPLGIPNGSGILPHFGSGMHAQNVLSGSALEKSIYWFKGVLALLVDSFVNDNGFKAAIVTATELGRNSGHNI
jgi:hypothetical protein